MSANDRRPPRPDVDPERTAVRPGEAVVPAGSSDDRLRLPRRTVLQWLGATAIVAAGGAGCVRKPHRAVVSQVTAPEFRKPGIPVHYATTWTEGRFPYGLVVTTQDGRPFKVEGNPAHPVNRGSTTPAMQAAIQALYDPARLRAPRGAASWAEADARIAHALRSAQRAVLITRATLGPSERQVLARFRDAFPAVQVLAFEPGGDGTRRQAWRDLYGQDGEWVPRLDRARVVLSAGSDFLLSEDDWLAGTRAFADARQPDDGQPDHPAQADRTRGTRLYVAEGDLSLTGMNADHRLRLRPSALPALLRAVRAAVTGQAGIDGFARDHRLDPAVLGALVRDLRDHRGEALVLAGAGLPAAVHAAAALLNQELDAPGRTLEWNPSPAAAVPDDPARIAAALRDGVDVLILLGVNPVYSWPGGGFADLLGRARLSVAHAAYLDETASACTLALPSHHNLESWNDAAPRPGLATVCQPALRPLFDTRQEAVSLMTWAGMPADGNDDGTPRPSFRAVVRRRFEQEVLAGAPSPSIAWQQVLRQGLALRETGPAPLPALDATRAEEAARTDAPPLEALELELRPHPGADDGRFGTLSWLLELPDPVTRQMWGNAVRLSPATAAGLGVAAGDVVEVSAGLVRVELPVLVVPGVADGVAGTDLGLGRRVEGAFGGPAGVNAWPLALPGARVRAGVTLAKTGRRDRVIQSQLTFDLHGRPLVLESTVERFRRDPQVVQKARHLPKTPTLYAHDPGKGPKWEMAIDLDRCTGCGSCVVACQAENNIPSVGPDECANGRELHWLRIDLYRAGPADEPRHLWEPMLCQHCDQAPCENVCPVNASAHSADGLNEQVYNRCIGTRYCNNNCPYKVRRFNFYRYTERFLHDDVQKLMANPGVTVRQVGVMEKCTFCIQRINAAKFRAANEDRPVADGEVVLACQQACPARAIEFGDVTRRGAEPPRIVRWSRSPRAFGVLEEQNFGPSVNYLARLWNPATGDDAPTDDAPHGGHG